MKLTVKFFCIAYIIVLLSTGIGGIFLINSANSNLWDSREERVIASSKYACDSFMSFADISSGPVSEAQLENIKKQIKGSLDSCVSELLILSESDVTSEYSSLADNEGFRRYTRRNGRYMLESVCRLNTSTDIYYITVYSDFTDIEDRTSALWGIYGAVVLGLSVISGLLLFIVARQTAKPINRLTEAANSISSGNYGETVTVETADFEIKRLAESFNTMSAMVKKTIEDIQAESDKRNMFVADFTHEIKTPMTAIIGYAQMLNSYDLNQKEIKQASRAIYKEGKRLERLSLQLLELYVYRNDEVVLEPVFLSDTVNQLETTLIFLSKKYNVKFTVDFCEVEVMANSVLLFSLLYNLADNAFKACAERGEVKINSAVIGDRVKISVSDNGKGISPENIKLLTEPFFREDKGRSRELGGAGLGLALCKEIAVIHNTELVFESELGKGTKVSFCLEREDADEQI